MANVEFDVEAVHEHANRLYRDARWIAGTYVLMGAILGIVLGGAVSGRLGVATVTAAVFLAVGGYVVGVDRAHNMRMEAQRLLCQLRIESNTRSSSSELRLALAKLAQAVERLAAQVDARDAEPAPPTEPAPKAESVPRAEPLPKAEPAPRTQPNAEPEPARAVEPEPAEEPVPEPPRPAARGWLAADGSDPYAEETEEGEEGGLGWVAAPTPRPKPAEQFEYLIWRPIDADDDGEEGEKKDDVAEDDAAAAAGADGATAEADAVAAPVESPPLAAESAPASAPAEAPEDETAYVYDTDAVDDDAWMQDAVPADDEAVAASADVPADDLPIDGDDVALQAPVAGKS